MMKHKKIIFLSLLFIAILGFGLFNGGSALTVRAQSLGPTGPTGTPAPTNTPTAGSATNNPPQTPSFYACVSSPATCGVYYVSTVINWFLGLGVSLGALLITYFLEINANLFGTTNGQAGIVQIGFSASLAIANLGFVFGIIVIALATILRNESYGMKQTLWKLIVMAILVNFGLVIARPIISFSDGFSEFFVQKTGGTDAGLVTNITNAFAPESLVNPSPANTTNPNGTQTPTVSTGSNFFTILQCMFTGNIGSCAQAVTPAVAASASAAADSFTQQLGSLLFDSVFLAIIAFTLITLAIMLLIRYIYLSILLILLPLAWLMWIFPGLSKHFSGWWSLFLKWTFFPAITLFFVYLALSIAPGANGQSATTGYLATSMPVPTGTGQQIPLVQTVLDQIVLCGLLLGGLYAANSLSITGANVAVGMVKDGGNYVKGYAARKTKNGARNVSDRARTAGRRYNPATKETTTALQRFGSRLQGVPGLRGLGSVVAKTGAPEALKKDREEDVKKHVDDELKSLTNDGLASRATSPTAFLSPTKAAAVGQELARRNMTNDPRIAPLMDRYLEVSEKMGNVQSILNNRPELAAKTSEAAPRMNTALGRMETIPEAQERAISSAVKKIKPADATQINHKSFGDYASPTAMPNADQINIALNMSNPQLSKLGNDGESEQIEAFRNTVRKTFDEYTAGRITLTPEQVKGMDRIIDYTTNATFWQNIV